MTLQHSTSTSKDIGDVIRERAEAEANRQTAPTAASKPKATAKRRQRPRYRKGLGRLLESVLVANPGDHTIGEIVNLTRQAAPKWSDDVGPIYRSRVGVALASASRSPQYAVEKSNPEARDGRYRSSVVAIGDSPEEAASVEVKAAVIAATYTEVGAIDSQTVVRATNGDLFVLTPLA